MWWLQPRQRSPEHPSSTPSQCLREFTGGPSGPQLNLAIAGIFGISFRLAGASSTGIIRRSNYSCPEFGFLSSVRCGSTCGFHWEHAPSGQSLVDRYYDPATGQFLSVDPLGGLTGQPYAFTGDDPLNKTDPKGLDTESGDIGGDMESVPVANPYGDSETFAEVDAQASAAGMIGDGGAQTTSTRLLNTPEFAIDVENPDPGGRPGQIHLQTPTGQKYMYNFETEKFEGLPRRLAKAIARETVAWQGRWTGVIGT